MSNLNNLDNLDNLLLEATDPNEQRVGDKFILTPGTWKVEVTEVDVVDRPAYQSNLMERVLEIQFVTVEPLTEDDVEADEADELKLEFVGKHGLITAWIRLAYQAKDERNGNQIRWLPISYQLVDPDPVKNPNASKSNLTRFIDDLFGRKLTIDEIAQLSFARLRGMRGTVQVVENKGGKAKFQAFRTPKNAKPAPSDFARPTGVTGVPVLEMTDVRTPQPKDKGNAPAAKSVAGQGSGDSYNADDFDDPFANE